MSHLRHCGATRNCSKLLGVARSCLELLGGAAIEFLIKGVVVVCVVSSLDWGDGPHV